MDAHYEDDAVTLYHGDSLEVLRELPAGSVDAVVTDPPYGISFMGKQWDQPGEYGSKRKNGTPAVHAREAGRDRAAVGDTGAMDAGRYDLSPHAMRNFQRWVEAWSGECLRVLKPGGHLLAFGGSRTWHRLAGGIEDAGFELRDSIAWLYGSGFPKSRDVSAQMQGYLSGERPVDAGPPVEVYTVTAYLREARDRAGWTNRQIDELFGTNGMSGHWVSRGSQPAVPSVRQWAVLKDRLGMGDDVDELVERLASTERPEDWGQGSGESFLESLRKDGRFESAGGWGTALKPAFEPVVVARKPVESSTTRNVAVYGTGALNVDGCRVPMTAEDRAEAEAKNAHARFGTEAGQNAVYGDYSTTEVRDYDGSRGRWPTNVLLDDVAAAALDRSTPERPARFFPTFRYGAKAPTAERPTVGGVSHPTVKPLELMRWLVRLVTPPGGVVLEPFAGSGTTAEACVVEGFRCVAIEREADYLPLIVSRLSKPLAPALDLGGLL